MEFNVAHFYALALVVPNTNTGQCKLEPRAASKSGIAPIPVSHILREHIFRRPIFRIAYLRLLRQVYENLIWEKFDTGEEARFGDYRLIVDRRKDKWAVSVTYLDLRSEQWPKHLDSIELAKDFALIMLDDCVDFVARFNRRSGFIS